MIRIDEIVALNGGLLAIIFTDTQSEQRDIALFKRHASAEDLDNLEVWRPKPTDETVTLTLEENTKQLIQNWADEHALEFEQLVRAFLYYIVRYELDVWRKAGEASIPWATDSEKR